MEPIRVLHVVGRMHRAGLETFIMNIYRNIDRNKIQFDFLTHYEKRGDYDDEIESLGGKIYRFSVLEDKNIIRYFKQLNSFFKMHKEYKIIHGHWATFGVFYMFFAKLNGIPYRIAHSHNDNTPPGLKGNIVNILIKPMKYLSNYYFACSQPAIYWLYGKNSKITKSGKVKIIKNAIDLKKYKFNPDVRKEYRKKLNLEDKFVIGHIGRMSYQKNQEFVIDIFKKIHEIDQDSILLLIGDGEDKIKLQKKVSELGLDQSVKFLGVRPDIPELLFAMDAFLFPSHFEALGIAAIEAQAAGLPTIVSTTIPEETHVTKLIKAIQLDKPIEYWVEQIVEVKNLNQSRINDDICESLKLMGYDVQEQAKFLENFYLSIYHGVN